MIDIVFQICSETVLFLSATAILRDGALLLSLRCHCRFVWRPFTHILRSIFLVQLPSFSFILHLFGDRSWIRRP